MTAPLTPTLDTELYACDECGNPNCMPCFDRDEDGEYQDSVPSRWLCDEHALKLGYCIFCGQREEQIDEEGVCDECNRDLIRDESEYYDD